MIKPTVKIQKRMLMATLIIKEDISCVIDCNQKKARISINKIARQSRIIVKSE